MIRKLFIGVLLLLALAFIGVGLVGYKWPMKSLFYLPGETVRLCLRANGGMVSISAAQGTPEGIAYATSDWSSVGVEQRIPACVRYDSRCYRHQLNYEVSDRTCFGIPLDGKPAPRNPARIAEYSAPYWLMPAFAFFVVFLCLRVRWLHFVRQCIRWCALVMAVVFFGVWLASLARLFSVKYALAPDREIELWASDSMLFLNYTNFSLIFNEPSPFAKTGINVTPRDPNMAVQKSLWLGVNPEFGVSGRLPLWLLDLMAFSVFGLVTLCDRKTRRGHCAVCDYDLRGNDSGVCPECGAAAVGQRVPPAVQ